MSLYTTIFQILKAIDVSYENKNFTLKTLDLDKLNISPHRLALHLENLIDKGYLNGATVRFGNNYEPIIGFAIPRLTLDGLDFLENNTSMKKAYNFLKEAKEWIPGL